MTLRVRAVSDEKGSNWAGWRGRARVGAGLVRRAQIILHALDGLKVRRSAPVWICAERRWALAQALQRTRAAGAGRGRAQRAATDLLR